MRQLCAKPVTLAFAAVVALALAAPAGCKSADDDACRQVPAGVAGLGAQCRADTDCPSLSGHAGICARGLCALQPSGGACPTDGARTGCPGGTRCAILAASGATAPACLPLCSCGACDGACDAEDVCRPGVGDNCDPRVCAIYDGPPTQCKTPPSLGAGPWFTRVTAEASLDASHEDVLGNRIALADIDEDGYPDLFVHRVNNTIRDDLDADPPRRYKRVLRNTAGPGGVRTFVDVTESSGYTATRDASLVGRSASFAVFADVNNDGHIDIFSGTYVNGDTAVPDPGDRSEILLGDGTGQFTLADQSDTSPGANDRWSTSGAAFLDYDLDGNVDLFVGFWYRVYGFLTGLQDRLYQGGGDGAFTDVTVAMGLETQNSGHPLGVAHRPTYGVTACDVDNDGDTDLLVSAYGRQWNMLWRNVNGTRFVEVGRESGFAADDQLDYSDNEFFRCYCEQNPSAPDCAGVPSARIGCGNFWSPGSDDQEWRLGGNTFTTVCGDVDNDGDMDLYNAEIRHWHIGDSSDPSQLLLGDGGTDPSFTRPGNAALGLARDWTGTSDWNEGDITAGFLDFDNDGLPDILLGSSDYPDTTAILWRQQANHTFVDVSAQAGVDHPRGNAVAFADYDRDGDLDLFIASSTARCSAPACPWTRPEVHLYRNDVGQDANWLAVRVVGAAGRTNVAAIGARIEVATAGVVQTREVQGGYGHFGLQNTLTQHFGLGGECLAESITVRWPNRYFTTDVFRWVPANYFITIFEDGGDGSPAIELEPPE